MSVEIIKCYILVTFGCIISGTPAETTGLRLTDVIIPRYMDMNQAAKLSCKFDLADGKLYSVKWYKDEFEFFRYMPENNPNIQTFPLSGVNLDLSNSNMTVITLHPLNFNSTGTYRCEVSTDGPNFETVVRNGNMTVIVFPDDEPSIEGIQSSYSVGDFITGNCTSARSNPPAELSWYINQDKVENRYMQPYPVSSVEENLYVRSLGLRFQLQKIHFGNNEYVSLRCSAKIEDLSPWERVTKLYSADQRVPDQRPPATDRFRNNSGARNFGVAVRILLLITYMISLYFI